MKQYFEKQIENSGNTATLFYMIQDISGTKLHKLIYVKDESDFSQLDGLEYISSSEASIPTFKVKEGEV